MMDSTRRSFLAGAALASTVAAAAAPLGSSFAGAHVPKALPFDPAKLNGISEKLIRSHWDNNYSGAVKALNALEIKLAQLLSDKDVPPFVYGPLKREELIRTGSVVLHDHYFGNLGGDGKPAGKMLAAIDTAFGSFDRWQTEFQRTAMSLAGGSGWAVLAHNAHTNSLHNYWMADHAHGALTGRPLLVLDMYEHAFQLDYGAAAGKYVEAFWKNVNWDVVEQRFANA